MTSVYYVTNRDLAEPMPYPEYGTTVVDPTGAANPLRWGVADVPTFAGDDEDRVGTQAIGLRETAQGLPDAAWTSALAGSQGNHLLVYVHGFNYTFRDAIRRSAWLSQWFGRAPSPVSGPIVCYSFPSSGRLLDENQSSFDKIFNGSYRQDYQNATNSAPAVVALLAALQGVVAGFRKANPGGRVTLLAHSLGNHVLANALGQAPVPAVPLFDRIISVAGDEAQDCVAAAPPVGSPSLTAAASWARAVYVYYHEWDLALWYSGNLHGGDRLGKYGPSVVNGGYDLPANFRVVNCSTASPSPGPDSLPVDDPDWEHHQYYRLYPWVRDDLALVMNGVGGVIDDPAQDVANFPNRRAAGQVVGRINLYDPPGLASSIRQR
ncbi:alpha/beta hydrolase [Telmatospirillum sp.]|uniref:alpha/beta hydrolase n=1 Tax=Telmatospirillum sp. TaxID=2079197 RepID=UPI0028488844|nr:alpha/beta hydrolase [Telmatospirillum sp.]MDR3436700.1 alpha/beta hydrolase [Telmatospirillum sp.]